MYFLPYSLICFSILFPFIYFTSAYFMIFKIARPRKKSSFSFKDSIATTIQTREVQTGTKLRVLNFSTKPAEMHANNTQSIHGDMPCKGCPRTSIVCKMEFRVDNPFSISQRLADEICLLGFRSRTGNTNVNILRKRRSPAMKDLTSSTDNSSGLLTFNFHTNNTILTSDKDTMNQFTIGGSEESLKDAITSTSRMFIFDTNGPTNRTKSHDVAGTDNVAVLWGEKNPSTNGKNVTETFNARKDFQQETTTNEELIDFIHKQGGFDGDIREMLEDNVSSHHIQSGTKRKKKGIIDLETVRSFLNIVQSVSVVAAGFSITAVILSVTVFLDQKMSSRVTLLVTAFNVAEGVKAFVYIVNRIWRLSLGNSIATWRTPYTFFFRYFITWCPDGIGRISLILNLIIALDRFVILAFPLKSINRKVITYPKLTIVLVVLAMIGFQTSSLILVLLRIDYKLNATREFPLTRIIAELGRVSPQSLLVYQNLHVVASICFRHIPLFLTITLNIMTIVSLWYNGRYNKERLQSTIGNVTSVSKRLLSMSAQMRKRQNNVMIIGSTLIFSFLVVIKPFVRVIATFHPTFGLGKLDNNLYAVVGEVALFMDVISPTVTFLSYLKLSSSFRAVLFRLFIKRASNQAGSTKISEVASNSFKN